MSSSEALKRGTEVTDSGQPITGPTDIPTLRQFFIGFEKPVNRSEKIKSTNSILLR